MKVHLRSDNRVCVVMQGTPIGVRGVSKLLTLYGDNVVGVIAVLRELYGFSLTECKEIVDFVRVCRDLRDAA